MLTQFDTLARVQQALGEPALAREAIERVVAMVQKDDLKQTFSQWAAHRARLDLMQGDLHAAAQWAQEIEPTIRGELNPVLEFKHITLAQIYLAQQRLDEAQQLLARLLSAAETAGRWGRALEIYLQQALIAAARGQRSEALTILERALRRAEPEGYIRTFVDMGAPMADLLREAHAHGIAPQYIETLLAAFGKLRIENEELRTTVAASAVPHSQLPEPLTPCSPTTRPSCCSAKRPPPSLPAVHQRCCIQPC